MRPPLYRTATGASIEISDVPGKPVRFGWGFVRSFKYRTEKRNMATASIRPERMSALVGKEKVGDVSPPLVATVEASLLRTDVGD